MQPATLAANQQHLLQHHLAANNCRQVPASPSSRQLHQLLHLFLHYQTVTLASPSSRHRYHPSPRAITLLGLAPAIRCQINPSPVNLGLHKREHRSIRFYSQYVYIFARLQICLQPDHIATPTICIKHRDHPYLDALSPRTCVIF